MYIDINDIDLNNDYFHFSNIENVDSILSSGLKPSMGTASQIVGDRENISVSKGAKGIMGIIGSFVYKFSEMKICDIPSEYHKYFPEITDFSSEKVIGKDLACNGIIKKLKDEVYFKVDLDESVLDMNDIRIGGFSGYDINIPNSIDRLNAKLITNNGKKLSAFDFSYVIYNKAKDISIFREMHEDFFFMFEQYKSILMSQNNIQDNLKNFETKNDIDFDRISNLPESKSFSLKDINELVSRYGIYAEKQFQEKSIADIIGAEVAIEDYDKNNISNNMKHFFTSKTPKYPSYDSRANGMLEYSSDEIIDKLSFSFRKEPIVLAELENNQSVVTTNGMHRYHLLRIHYLNELSKIEKTPENLQKLREKYTIQANVEKVDLLKTYSNFLISNMQCDEFLNIYSEYDENYIKTGNVVLSEGSSKMVLNDNQLLEYINNNLYRLTNKETLINNYCERIPSFNYFIETYFPEMKNVREGGNKIK